MKIDNASKLVFIGDSITDCNRTKPAGEGLFEATGRGYVSLIEALLASAEPARRIRVVNQGTSGNTVRDLAGRWEEDVLARKPDWLSIMIGINDVWRQFDMPLISEAAVQPEEYQSTLESLLAQTRPKLKGLVLMSPFMIEPNKADPMRARMDEYGTIVREAAARHDAIFVDVQAAFDEVLKHHHPMALAWDRIHPNAGGHMVIARAFLKSVGFAW